MWVLDLTVGCWELNLNLSLHVQLFEHLNFILRGPTKRELNVKYYYADGWVSLETEVGERELSHMSKPLIHPK